MIKRRTKVLLTIAILMQSSSYFLPFPDSMNGYVFFKKGVEAFFKDGIGSENWYAFYAFFAPILSFPILLLGLLKSFSSSIMKRLQATLFIFLLSPVLLSIMLVLSRSNILSPNCLGYILWAISFCVMYGILFFKKSEQDEIGTDDLNRHLIEDEI